ncbi:unnamed protein product, partial [Phaeothamnion confervicola]
WVLAQGYAAVPVRIQADGSKKPQVREWTTKKVDPTYIKRLARKNDPDLLFAVATGDLSGGLIALDFDGVAGMATLRGLGLQPTLTTPGGGAHVWVSAPGLGARTRGYVPAFPAMEVKANGGKVTFHGENKTKGGRRYEFTEW